MASWKYGKIKAHHAGDSNSRFSASAAAAGPLDEFSPLLPISTSLTAAVCAPFGLMHTPGEEDMIAGAAGGESEEGEEWAERPSEADPSAAAGSVCVGIAPVSYISARSKRRLYAQYRTHCTQTQRHRV